MRILWVDIKCHLWYYIFRIIENQKRKMERLTERKPNSETEINFSMQNMLDSATFYAAFFPIETYKRIAQQAGYQRIEYFPWRFLPNWQAFTRTITKETLSAIGSAHQSFRSERTIREVLAHPKRGLATMAFLALPERNASLKNLHNLQEKIRLTTGEEIPLVVYPPHEHEGEKIPPLFNKLTNKLLQPTPDFFTRWGVKTIDELIATAVHKGYSGFCLDLLHLREKGSQGEQFPPWRKTLPKLLPHTAEIHVSVGRRDFQLEGSDSFRELTDLYTDSRKTEIVTILETIRDFGWKGPVVTEIPGSSLREVLSTKTLLVKPKDFIAAHQEIVNTLKGILVP